jgi:hypothetical protein
MKNRQFIWQFDDPPFYSTVAFIHMPRPAIFRRALSEQARSTHIRPTAQNPSTASEPHLFHATRHEGSHVRGSKISGVDPFE